MFITEIVDQPKEGVKPLASVIEGQSIQVKILSAREKVKEGAVPLWEASMRPSHLALDDLTQVC